MQHRWRIDGTRYVGWGAAAYRHDLRAWEAKFTPGRHCQAFRGVLGVVSDDGVSGTVKLTADDQLIYESPALTPGMDLAASRAAIPSADRDHFVTQNPVGQGVLGV